MAFSVPDVEAVTPPITPMVKGNSRYVRVPADWPNGYPVRLILLATSTPPPPVGVGPAHGVYVEKHA